MGNCLASSGRSMVHPAVQRPSRPEGGARRAWGAEENPRGLFRVRMTAREFKELLARARTGERDTAAAAVGVLIADGVRRGRWEAVAAAGCAVQSGRGGGNRSGGNHLPGNAATPLETIHEDGDGGGRYHSS